MGMQLRPTWLASVLMVAVGVVAGCGGSGALVPVEGKVTLNNKPLAGASVMFSQSRPNLPGPFVGETDAEGRFQLGPSNSAGGGAAVGEYIVVITTVKQAPGGMEDSPPPTQQEVVPMKYRDGTERFAVPSGGTKDANFDLKGR
jgi:hypothetical protein